MIQYHTRSQEDTQSFQKTWSVENHFSTTHKRRRYLVFQMAKIYPEREGDRVERRESCCNNCDCPTQNLGSCAKSWYADKCKTTCIELHRKQQQQQIIQNHWRFWHFVKMGFQSSPLGSAMVTHHLQRLFSSCPSKNSKVSWQQLPSTFLNKAEQLAAWWNTQIHMLHVCENQISCAHPSTVGKVTPWNNPIHLLVQTKLKETE